MKNVLIKILPAAAILAAVLSLAACGGGTDETTAGSTAAETTAVETATVPETTTQTGSASTEPPTKPAETTTQPATQNPDETPGTQPLQPAVGQSAVVSSTATNFGSKSGGVKMALFVPGSSFTVYQISSDQVLIGLDGVFTGWVNKTDLVGQASFPSQPDEPSAPTEPATTAPATTKPATTQPDNSVKAPVGGSVAQIVSFYNQYANALRNYSGKVTVKKADGTVTVINSISGGAAVKNLAQDMLPNDYSAKPDLTFNNGKSGNTSLAGHLPRGDEAKMSVLQPEGVASAACVVNGSGWKVTVSLKPETVAQLSGVPKYTAQCMDTLSLTESDLKPFTLQSATVTYANCKIEAVMDSLGRITKLDIVTPATIAGKLKYGIVGINADVTGTYKGNYTFIY